MSIPDFTLRLSPVILRPHSWFINLSKWVWICKNGLGNNFICKDCNCSCISASALTLQHHRIDKCKFCKTMMGPTKMLIKMTKSDQSLLVVMSCKTIQSRRLAKVSKLVVVSASADLKGIWLLYILIFNMCVWFKYIWTLVSRVTICNRFQKSSFAFIGKIFFW